MANSRRTLETGGLTVHRWWALQEVERGEVRWGERVASWHPAKGYERPATFEWLVDEGLIDIEYEGEPKGRVVVTRPVVLTNKGREVLAGDPPEPLKREHQGGT